MKADKLYKNKKGIDFDLGGLISMIKEQNITINFRKDKKDPDIYTFDLPKYDENTGIAKPREYTFYKSDLLNQALKVEDSMDDLNFLIKNLDP